MSQIVLVDNQETLRSLIKLNLIKCTGHNIVAQKNISEAIAFLETDFDNSLIICRDKIESKNSSLLIIDFLNQNKLNVPLLVIGEVDSDYHNLYCLDEGVSWQEIIYKSGEILNIAIDLEQSLPPQSFSPIGINYFLETTGASIGSDIYIRVKKGNDYHYVKRFRSDDQLCREDIERYKSSGLKYFHISKDQFKDFVDNSIKSLVSKLGNEKITGTDRNKLNSNSYDLMIERIQQLGIDQGTIKLVEFSVNSMKKSLGEKNALAGFLESLHSNKNSYGYSHSFLICLILHKISHKMYWFTFRVKEKLTLISFFHDISLPEELAFYNSDEKIMSSQLYQSDKDLIKNHAMLSASIVGAFDFVPEDVSSIIREHHGAANGIGFPSNMSISISPISQMFVVVEDFVDEFLSLNRNPSEEDIDRILGRLKIKYTKLTYEKTALALCELFQLKKHL